MPTPPVHPDRFIFVKPKLQKQLLVCVTLGTLSFLAISALLQPEINSAALEFAKRRQEDKLRAYATSLVDSGTLNHFVGPKKEPWHLWREVAEDIVASQSVDQLQAYVNSSFWWEVHGASAPATPESFEPLLEQITAVLKYRPDALLSADDRKNLSLPRVYHARNGVPIRKVADWKLAYWSPPAGLAFIRTVATEEPKQHGSFSALRPWR